MQDKGVLGGPEAGDGHAGNRSFGTGYGVPGHPCAGNRGSGSHISREGDRKVSGPEIEFQGNGGSECLPCQGVFVQGSFLPRNLGSRGS